MGQASVPGCVNLLAFGKMEGREFPNGLTIGYKLPKMRGGTERGDAERNNS